MTDDKIIKFPQPDFFPQRGERVLSLWFEDEDGWTSTFYPCTIFELDRDGETRLVLKVKFDGDCRYSFINSQWAVQPEYMRCPRQ